MNDLAKNMILYVIIAVILAVVINNFTNHNTPEPMLYSDFLTKVNSDGIKEVVFQGDLISGKRTDGDKFLTYSPETTNSALIEKLQAHNVTFSAAAPERQSFLMQLFISSFPILLLIGVWVYFMRQMQGGAGGRGAMSFGKSRA
ncbi:MAG TPA: ATP-dependent metallopeptidase FtsH/Yme1/Tma family protein, partial [Steroidobacteraceae bacterium]|nr:ATP-dependent metallopeptidase FtsH/Yme1/Tma family protein [Steroidobacteraceae bacterium]